MKVGIDMGVASSAPGGQSALLDLEELLATRLLVQGNSGSGKSHLLRRLLEQSAALVQQAIIDPEGDFVTLADKFGHVVVDASRSEGDLQRIAARVRQHRVSVVLSLEGLDAEAQMRCAAAFLGGLFDAERDYWYPMLVVVDEAQLFAPAAAGDVSDEARKVSLGAMTNLMCRGRKRGLAGIIATQRLAKLAKNVAAEASNFLMGRTFLDIDMARAADLLGMERRQAEMFRDLERGHFVALGPALSRRPLPIRIGAVETSTRSGTFKLMPLPGQPKEEARDLIFKAGEDELAARPVMPRRAPPPPPAPSTNDLLAQLARTRPAAAPEAQPQETEQSKAEREAALDAILREILDDPEAAFRSVAVLYQDFLVRCRIRRVSGEPLNLNAFRRRLAVARAGVDTATADGTEWDRAVAFAADLAEDIQGIYLLIARAAMEGSPCPPDGEIARACGSRSPGRARRLIAYMESRNIVVTRNDPRGLRIIALPDLGWETGPGDPNAFEELQAPETRDLFAVG
ncbi:ATP-binding protein [Microvirga sp. CF3016]|uniref:ATP-binding protein n=1 Tax=Microvirga sp. CF3016 TaxID=3110181 RepID=UPI002E78EED8|nr:ATP-binding protein [Microvirga sp. CF3016]MEE1612923.1 ATP-binding protein [Microvirga sp. CF3016]